MKFMDDDDDEITNETNQRLKQTFKQSNTICTDLKKFIQCRT